MSDPDEFDQIVAGLDFDLGDAADLDAEADRAAAQREAAERDRERAERAAQVEQTDDDDQFYREVSAVAPRRDRPTRWARIALVVAPALLFVTVLLPWRPPALLTAVLVLTCAAAVGYLIARLPERGPSNPDWPDDGAVL